jgi:NhaA family Na+:H+ antiporter
MAQDKSSSGANIDIIASLVLLAATIAALVIANSPLGGLYKSALALPIDLSFAGLALEGSLKTWIKDALMAIFFLLVGLEIKAEFQEGALSDRRRATLPFTAAAGGMAVPAILYLAIAGQNPAYASGWAIPSATDIAFAVGVVGLLGSRVPPALKAFLLAVAVIDDLGAILIIAFFYTASLNLIALAVAAALVGVLLAANRLKVMNALVYVGVGILLWLALSQSGVSPTLSGVIAALFVPLRDLKTGRSPLHDLGHALKAPVLLVVMPVFAFANAGVPFAGLGLDGLAHPITLGIAIGLVLGKPLGITLFALATIKLGLARLPDATSWTQVIGVGCIAGIGFTMSLFVGALAFADPALMDQVRLGVLSGSLVATLLGVTILLMARPVQASVSARAPAE